MIGLGTIINVALIIFGGLCGLLFKKLLSENLQKALLTATGVAVVFLGIGGVLEKMLTIEDGKLSAGGTAMMIVSMAIGALVGEIINIEGGIEKFGEWLKKKSKSDSDSNFISSFVTASCTVCIGAMAIIGAFEDALHHDYTILLAKGILDAIFIAIMSASKGKGCIFSAISVAIFQGLFTVLALIIGPFMSMAALDNLSFVGSILIFCIGLNFLRDKKIKVANLLPAILIAVLWSFIPV